MQPYFFPYIGYFQLVAAVDTFVILDDVYFIKRGWINRNNILLQGSAHLFSIPVNKPSQNVYICDTKLKFLHCEKEKFLTTIQLAYKKAPEYHSFYPIFEECVMLDEEDLTSYIHYSLSSICNYLDLPTKIIRSTQIEKDPTLKAQGRILAICKALNTRQYINPAGGTELYSKEDFSRESIELRFINTIEEGVVYPQFSQPFVPYLSFIDALMFNNKETLRTMLGKYTLV